MLKALADETRWKIVSELLKNPLTIGEVGVRLDVTQYNVSKHVRILREAGIVRTRRDGQRVICEVADGLRHKLENQKGVLDLGCCTFDFKK
jgi:DNA-binding transcriptional ArsR family regulator